MFAASCGSIAARQCLSLVGTRQVARSPTSEFGCADEKLWNFARESIDNEENCIAWAGDA
jgi:hypothetical protein